jgi:signal transduction histidine kinase/ligand-binding sensor domain-containing protein
MRRLPCAALVAFWCAGATGSASTNSLWYARSWQTDEGLPNNHVTAIAQGADGYLWVGTPAGLLQFDGVRFVGFPFREGGGNDISGVHAISPRRAGGLWVLPSSGPLAGFDAAFSRVYLPTNGLPKGSPVGVAEDRQGALWMAYPSALYELKNGALTHLGADAGVPAAGNIFSLVRDSAGAIWMAKGSRAGIFRDGQFQPFPIRTATRMVRLAAARTNGVWIATGTRLFKCDAEGKLQDFGVFEADNPRAESWALVEDRTGAVWIGTDGSGLFRRGEAGFEKITISHPYVLSLAEDREGNIWAGTAGGGLTRISLNGVQLEGLQSGPSSVAIQSICEDTNGVLWGVTQNGLLVSRVDGRWGSPFTNAASLGMVTCVAADRNGAVWIGTRNKKLHRWQNHELSTWGANEGVASHTVVGLLPSSTGALWASEIGLSAVQCLRDGILRTVTLPAGAGRITALAEDAAGRVWLGSASGMLMRAEGDRLVDESSLISSSRQAILCLYTTPDKALWIGYDSWGLGQLKDGHFARISTEQGLLENHISEIVGDDYGWLWFGGAGEISKIQKKELEAAMADPDAQVLPVRYGRNEGLFSVEANSVSVAPFVSPTALRSRDGHLWMPLRTAIAAVSPQPSHEDSTPVLVTRVSVDNRTVAGYGEPAQPQPIANLKTLSAPLQVPAGHRKLEFEFTALSFSAPENVRFRYRLQGVDDDWLVPETRSVSYTRLGAGSYQFRVQASDGNGPWREAETPVGILVPPLFWQTWWFRAGVVTLFTGLVIAMVRYVSFRRLRMRLRVVQQQAALDKERARIARDLHDDLGCSLTQVALTLDMAHHTAASPGGVKATFQQCSALVRQVAGSVDEIVWAINPRNDTLPYLVDYLSQFAVEFLDAAGIICSVELPENAPNLAITPEARHSLFLVAKEALNNIVRHARATEVSLTITASAKELGITFRDNGCGFACAPDNASANGLRNMRQRMEELGGRFELESKPGAGTRVSLGFPCAP